MVNDFSIKDFIESLKIDKDDHYLKTSKQTVEIIALLNDDPYAARADFYGLTSSAFNTIEYNGNVRLAYLEKQLNKLEGNGYLSESDISVSWHSNEDKVHDNNEVPHDEQVDDKKLEIDRCVEQMTIAAIKFAVFLPEHDKLSNDLELKTFSEIRAAGAAKRSAAVSQRTRKVA